MTGMQTAMRGARVDAVAAAAPHTSTSWRVRVRELAAAATRRTHGTLPITHNRRRRSNSNSNSSSASRVAGVLAYAFLALVLMCFSCGVYSVLQASLLSGTQTINPVLYPLFSKVDTRATSTRGRDTGSSSNSSSNNSSSSNGSVADDGAVMANTHETYYRVWRVYDWVADGYTAPRQHASEQLRVPALYIHGNAGSYFCARSMARFVYEANAQRRRRAVRNFDVHVKQHLYAMRQTSGNKSSSDKDDGDDDKVHSSDPGRVVVATPAARRRAEEAVAQTQLPLLAVELFSLDYHEESNVHSGALMLKQARYMAHVAQALLARFARTYAPLLQPASTRPEHEGAQQKATTAAAAMRLVRSVEREYLQSLCNNVLFDKDTQTCRRARALLARFASEARLREEVARVRARGLWAWGESVGGVVALLAAVLQPRAFAGIVLVGTPVQQLPLFLDDAGVHMYTVLARAFLYDVHYAASSSNNSSNNSSDDDDDDKGNTTSDDDAVDEAVLAAALALPSPLTALQYLRSRPADALAARVSRVALLSMNGGALDHIVTSTATSLQMRIREGNRHAKSSNNDTAMATAVRRDVSTEELRGCGMPMDHRGLVYGTQFLRHAANSLVQAALLPHTRAYMLREDALPSPSRERLWPTVDEALSPSREAAWRFAQSLHETTEGGYALHERQQQHRHRDDDNNNDDDDDDNDVTSSSSMMRVCTHNAVPLHVADVAASSSEGVVHVLLGVTTYAPEAVHAARLFLYDDAALTRRLRHTHVDATTTVTTVTSSSSLSSWQLYTTAATKLHLPFERRDTSAVDGQTLRTVISFRLVARVAAATTTSSSPQQEEEAAQQPQQHTRDEARVVWPQFCFVVDARAHAEAAGHHSNSRTARTQADTAATAAAAAAQRSFVQYTRMDVSGFATSHDSSDSDDGHVSLHRRVWRRVVPWRRALRVRHGSAHVLVDGVDPLSQETSLTVHTANTSSVFPVTMCSSLTAFTRTLHGTDDSSSSSSHRIQTTLVSSSSSSTASHGAHVQYFFGPFVPLQRRFDYSWRPPNTFPVQWRSVYVVYVIGDEQTSSSAAATTTTAATAAAAATPHSSVRIELRDTAALLTPRGGAAQQLLLRCWRVLCAWPRRWLLFLLLNSEMGKLLSSYGLLWFVLMHVYGVMDSAFASKAHSSSTVSTTRMTSATTTTTRTRRRLTPLLLRVVRAAAPPHPLLASLLAVTVLETVASVAVDVLLPACTARAHNGGGDTLPPSWLQYAAMALLYGQLPLSSRQAAAGWWHGCEHGWVRMHTTQWPWFVHKMASVYLGFCIAAVAQVLLACLAAACSVVGWPMARLLLRPLLSCAPRGSAVVLALLWATAPVAAATLPWLPSCYAYLLSLALLYTVVLATLPPCARGVPHGGCYWRVCMLSSTAIFFAAYGDGLLLVVRNHIALRNAPAVFWDSSRYALTPSRRAIFALVQAGLALLYATAYLVARSEATHAAAATAAAAQQAHASRHGRHHRLCNGADEHDVTQTRDGTVTTPVVARTAAATSSLSSATLRRRREQASQQQRALPSCKGGRASVAAAAHTSDTRGAHGTCNGNGHTTPSHSKRNDDDGDSEEDDESKGGSGGYVLGSLCRRWRWLRALTHHGQAVMLLLAVWVCVVALRRPLEGQVAVTGLLLLYGYQLCFLVRTW